MQRRLRAAGSGSVTLVDAWGPGHPRASSGGETRMLRGVYGPHPLYTEWVLRALDQWRRAETDWGTRFFHRTGLLWLCAGEAAYVEAARPCCEAVGWPLEELSVAEAGRRFPQISTDGVSRAFWEENAGYLLARRGTEAVAAALAAAGGQVRLGSVRRPLAGDDGRLAGVELADGSRLPADLAVFACGPWTAELFPELLAEHLVLSRQEVFYFGPPAGDRRFAPRSEGGELPAWIDFSAAEADGDFYSIPGSERRGVKLADDRRGPPLDPTRTDRRLTPEALALARRALERRLPGMAGAPLVEARVCQYTNSPDGDFVLDRHPEIEGLWIAAAGSGHGYKLGPAVGESFAGWVLDEGEPEPRFRLGRLGREGEGRLTQFEAL